MEYPVDEFFNSGIECYEAKYLSVDALPEALPVTIRAILERNANEWSTMGTMGNNPDVQIHFPSVDVPNPKKGDRFYIKDSSTSSQIIWTMKEKILDGTGITTVSVTKK